MTLSYKFIEEIDQFIAVLDQLTKKEIFRFNIQSTQLFMEGSYFFSSWFDPKTLNGVAYWIAAIFERKIVTS